MDVLIWIGFVAVIAYNGLTIKNIVTLVRNK